MTAATRLGALGLAGCANDATDTGSSTATGATGEQVSAGLADRQILDQAILANPNRTAPSRWRLHDRNGR